MQHIFTLNTVLSEYDNNSVSSCHELTQAVGTPCPYDIKRPRFEASFPSTLSTSQGGAEGIFVNSQLRRAFIVIYSF